MDLNGDGRVERKEMINFLTKKNIDADHRDEIVDEIFRKCDIDGNGFIELEEFVQHYLDIKNQLEQASREREVSMKILDQEIQRMEK